MSDEEPVREPRATAELVGHERAEAQLLELWNAGRMPHALMIAGEPGIGKATLAFRLARFALAQGEGQGGGLFGPPDSLYVAPEDPTFRRVASGGHVDLTVLQRPWDEKRGRRRGVIPVEDVRAATERLRLTSGQGGWRVVVIDAVDDLNPSAANALLKILEAPPPHVLLILVAQARGRILPTIRSRCRQLALQPLPADQAERVVAAARPDDAPADRALAVALAEDSPGRAITLLEQEAAEIYGAFVALLGSLPDYPLARAMGFADKVGAPTDDTRFAVFADLFTGWLARLLRGSSGAQAAVGEEGPLNARLRGGGALDPWFEVWDKAGAWFAEANGLNMDRKQAVLSVLEACAGAARRATASS